MTYPVTISFSEEECRLIRAALGAHVVDLERAQYEGDMVPEDAEVEISRLNAVQARIATAEGFPR